MSVWKKILELEKRIDYLEEKVDSVEGFIDGQWDVINKYNPFS